VTGAACRVGGQKPREASKFRLPKFVTPQPKIEVEHVKENKPITEGRRTDLFCPIDLGDSPFPLSGSPANPNRQNLRWKLLLVAGGKCQSAGENVPCLETFLPFPRPLTLIVKALRLASEHHPRHHSASDFLGIEKAVLHSLRPTCLAHA